MLYNPVPKIYFNVISELGSMDTYVRKLDNLEFKIRSF